MKFISKPSGSVLLGGVFFILPILLILLLVKSALDILVPLGLKLSEIFDIHSVIGATSVTAVSLLILVALCYISGLLLKRGLVNDWDSKMEDRLFLLIPSLQMIKYRLLTEGEGMDNKNRWKAILLKEDRHYSIAFITNTDTEGNLSIYIPDAPRMDAGEIRIMAAEDCDYRPISMKQAMAALGSFGRDGDLGGMLGKKNNSR